MKNNAASVVMAQRKEPKDSLDLFPTPPWATRALVEHVLKPLDLYNASEAVWEPACGLGHMVRPLREYYDAVYYSDIKDYGGSDEVIPLDFLSRAGGGKSTAAWVITNPPFNNLLKFITTGLEVATIGVAMFCQLRVLETIGRYNEIFLPYAGGFCIAPFVERVPILSGRLDRNSSTATAYAWLVISHDKVLTPLIHIPPCRKRLEKDSDYELL